MKFHLMKNSIVWRKNKGMIDVTQSEINKDLDNYIRAIENHSNKMIMEDGY